jgi:hypothetical protein
MRFSEYFNIFLEHNEIQMPRLFDALKNSSNDLIGAHFSHSNQISFNPKPNHYDPIGIYCFPKKYILDGNLIANTGFAKYPFIFLIQPSSKAKILNLDMSEKRAKELLTKMGIPEDLLHSDKIYHNSSSTSIGHQFWGVMEYWRNTNQLTKNSSWNTLFSKIGYTVLYDPGFGIIHSNEKSQIVYMTADSYKVVDVILNNMSAIIALLKKEFPDFKLTNSNSTNKKKYGDSLGYYFQNKDREYFNVSISKMNSSIDVNINGNHRQTYYKDYENIVSDIREFLKKYKNNHQPLENDPKAYAPLFELAKEFGITVNKNNNEIERHYGSNTLPETKLIFNLNFSPKTEYSEKASYYVNIRRFTIKIDKNVKNEEKRYRVQNYFYSKEIPYESQTPKEVMKNIFDKFESSIEKDLKSDDWDVSHKASLLKPDVSFLKNRVFRIK